MKNILLRHQKALEVLFLIILSLTPLLWFKDHHIVVGLDSGYAVDYVRYFIQRLYTWLGSQNFGIDMSIEVGIVPYNALPALIQLIGVGYFNVQKVLFVGWFFLILMSMYIFTNYIFPQKYFWSVRLIASIVFAFNLHIYSFWLQGEQPILSSYVVLPLFILYILKIINDEISLARGAVILNIIYLFFGSGGLRGFPLIGPVILISLLLFVYYFIVRFETEGLQYFKRFFKLALIFIPILILTNAYYLLPFIFSRNSQFNAQVSMVGGLEGTVAWLKMVSSHASFSNVFRLHGDNNWYDKPYLWAYQYIKNPVLIIISSFLPILTFSAVLIARKRREFILILFFTISALVSLYFASGSNSPFGFLYVVMMKFVPGFAAFRSAYYKFMPAVIFSYAILIGYSVYHIGNCFGKWYKNLFFILCTAILFIYHYPYFTNTNFVFNKPFGTMVQIPEYVTNFASMRNVMQDDFRTLIVPHSNRSFPLKTYIWGYWGSYPIFPLISDKNFVQYDPFLFNASENKLVDTLYQLLRKKDYAGFVHAATITHVRYILLTKDIASDYQLAPTENPLVYDQMFTNNPYFYKIWGQGQWIMYKIVGGNSYPKIHAAVSLTLQSSEVNTITNVFEQGNEEFIVSNQLDAANSRVVNHYINSINRSLRCASCTIKSVIEDPVMPVSSIYPGSILYKYKIYQDNGLLNKIQSQDEKLGSLLGLTAKRISELSKLIDMQIKLPIAPDWFLAMKQLESNWLAIEKIVMADNSNPNNYDRLYLIYRYSLFEKNVLQKILVASQMARANELSSSVENSFSVVDRFTMHLESKLFPYAWDRTFVYALDSGNGQNIQNTNVFIYTPSLPKSIEGKVVLPHYQIDDDVATHAAFLQNDTVQIGNLPKSTKKLTLYFDTPTNLLQDIIERQVSLAGTVKNCLASKIHNYSWGETYVIRSKSVTQKAPKFIYIQRDHRIFPTEDFPGAATSYFQPDLTLSPSNEANSYHLYEYKGQQNDTGASVYFCTDSPFSPREVFSEISVSAKYIPQAYSVETRSVNAAKAPIITYAQVNPTHYKIFVKNATDPFVLSFLEGFSQNWILLQDGKEIKNHFILNGYANGWKVTKSGTYTLELYFYTQQLMIVGIIISAISTIMCVLYLVVMNRKKYKV